METRFAIEPLGDAHDRAAFSCGVDQLDRYLHQLARQDLKKRVAGVFVACPIGTTTIAGYYTLSATSIITDELPPDLARRLPRHRVQPAILLGRLAVDRRFQGQGLGAYLVASAFQRSLSHSREIGAMAVVVDALDEAAARFYAHHDFLRFPGDPLRLYCPMPTIARMFEG